VRDLTELLQAHQAALSFAPEGRREWLNGLTPEEGANLFAEIHNNRRSGEIQEKFYKHIEGLNWINYNEKMQ